ncbi:MAG: thioesterase [Acidobacteria bacterium RBG_16_64_8]|nr:MAG: thioesterase [Acidobacteria bacterium RBG_16_64_8]
MSSKAVQDYYADDLAWCYGCGRLNPDGYQLKTVWEGDETVTRFTPRSYHIAIPGYVNGGVLASLIDCHGTGSAAAAAYRAEGREVGDGPAPRYVTASLRVDYLKPTPLGVLLEVRGRIKETKGRKVVVDAELSAGGEVTVRGEVVAVQMPEHLRARES